jgi:hypothetical protein
VLSFKKLIFRATRGTAYTQFFEFEVEQKDRIKSQLEDYAAKVIYIVIFQGGDFSKDKIIRVCQNTLNPVYEVDHYSITRDIVHLERQKNDAKDLINKTKEQLKLFLIGINDSGSEFSSIAIYRQFIQKERAIYTELNKLRDDSTILAGLFRCPSKYKEQLEFNLRELKDRNPSACP